MVSFVLAQGMEQVRTVEDQRPVEQLAVQHREPRSLPRPEKVSDQRGRNIGRYRAISVGDGPAGAGSLSRRCAGSVRWVCYKVRSWCQVGVSRNSRSLGCRLLGVDDLQTRFL